MQRTRTEQRRNGTARVIAIADDDGSFDREFWASFTPAERLATVWEMVLEYLEWRDPDAAESQN